MVFMLSPPPVRGVWVSSQGSAAAPGVSALPAPRGRPLLARTASGAGRPRPSMFSSTSSSARPGGFVPQFRLGAVPGGRALPTSALAGGLLLVKVVKLVLHRLQPLGHLTERIVDASEISTRVSAEVARWVIWPFSRSIYSCRKASNDTDIAKPR